MSEDVLRIDLAGPPADVVGRGVTSRDAVKNGTAENILDDGLLDTELLESVPDEEVLRLSESVAKSPGDDDGRFDRFELIGWWDQSRLSRTRALVIGAGAIGNELIKNLALLGIGKLLVVDLDRIENSNLSRSVLYRAEDCGRSKAAVAAERATDIYPDMSARGIDTNVVHDFGLGVYRWADVILGGLDNREARVAINAAAARCGKPWIDGAIERLSGVARVFDAATGPCYECTMNATDWKMLEARRSCALLTRDEMAAGKVPTTPTTSSVIAGIQAQEAVKLIHGMPGDQTLTGRGFVFDGVSHQSYDVTYSRRDDCPAHEADGDVVELPLSAAGRVGDLVERVCSDLGPGAVVEANHDLLSGLTCPACGETEPRFGSLGKTTESDAVCGSCGGPRTPELYHTFTSATSWLDKPLAELGVPAWDVLAGRVGDERRFYELSSDRDAVLGVLSGPAAADAGSPHRERQGGGS